MIFFGPEKNSRLIYRCENMKKQALNENPTAPRFFAAMRNETNSVFVAAHEFEAHFRQAIERRQR
jgi:hypothetical protein